jgi:hypothetical protein
MTYADLRALDQNSKDIMRLAEQEMFQRRKAYREAHQEVLDRICTLMVPGFVRVRCGMVVDVLKNELKVDAYCYVMGKESERGVYTGRTVEVFTEEHQLKIPGYVVDDPSRLKEFVLKAIKKNDPWTRELDIETLTLV